MAKRTHHKHSSTKGYRRLLDRLADHPDVHRVATGRVTPRMGAGRPGRADLEGAPGRVGPLDHDQRRRRDRSTPTSSPTAPTRSRSSWPSRAGRRRERRDAARGARPRRRRAARATRPRRHEPARQGAAAHSTATRSAGSARRLPRRQRAGLGDQRQDDDRGAGGAIFDARRASPTVHNVAGANMAGGVASALLRRGRAGARSASSRSTSSGSPRSPPRSRRARSCSRNLFRDQLDRYGELEIDRRALGRASSRRRRRGSC